MQHYHSRLHVICVCCPDPESKKSSHKWSPSSGSSPEWEGRGCPAPWAAMGISCFQEHVLWRPKKKHVCWLHLAFLGHFFCQSQHCWWMLDLFIPVCCSEVTQKCFSWLSTTRDTCPPVSALVLGTVPEKPWTLGCSNNLFPTFQQWNLWSILIYDLSPVWTYHQFRSHTVQMRNLETRRSAGGDHPPQVQKKTSSGSKILEVSKFQCLNGYLLYT